MDHALKQALTKSISSLSLGHQVYGIWIQMQWITKSNLQASTQQGQAMKDNIKWITHQMNKMIKAKVSKMKENMC